MDGLAIAASLGEVRPAVQGGRVRAVYRPAKDVLVIHVARGEGTARVLISPRRAELHLTRLDLPNPPHPGAFAMLLRRHLRGSRIARVRQRGWDRVVTLDIERDAGRTARAYELVAELVGVRGNLFLLQDGLVLGSAHPDARNRPGGRYSSLPSQAKLDPEGPSAEALAGVLSLDRPADGLMRSIDGIGRATAADLVHGLGESPDAAASAERLRERLRQLLACVGNPSSRIVPAEGRATFYPLPPPAVPATSFAEALDAVSEAVMEGGSREEESVRAEIRRAISRRQRTAEKLREWLDDADEAERLRWLADLLMIHHAEIEPKADRAVVRDPATDQEETIRLDPSLNAIENAQRLYERAKRLKRGRPHVTSRLGRLEGEVLRLERALADYNAGRPIHPDALNLLPAVPPSKGKRDRPLDGPSVEMDGFTIRIGRNARENDRLLREAAPDDVWLHAKGCAGSHVIIHRGGRREIPDAVVRHAARLAAAHSKARTEGRVEVVMAQAKHVRKPKGAPAGLVNVTQGDTLTVEP